MGSKTIRDVKEKEKTREKENRYRHRSSERKRHRSKHASSSSRSSSTDHSSKEGEFEHRLKHLRHEKKKRKKLEKERKKAMESLEEKRARRLAKKLKKEEKRKAELGHMLSEDADYTNLNNPFNDPNLTQPFVWSKKLESEGLANLPMREIEKMSKMRAKKNYAEMEELKKNREAREAAREDLEMIRRDEERRSNYSWEQTEEMFHLNQAKLRSRIRLREGRAKPIDYLARYITFDDVKKNGEKTSEDEEFDLEMPLVYLDNLTTKDLEDLMEDIKVYMKIDHDKNQSWWLNFQTVISDELRKLVDDVRSSSLRDSIHGSVQTDVAKILEGKSLEELSQLETKIKSKIHEGREGTDIAYWESLLTHLQVHIAKAQIRERHNEMLQFRYKKIKEEQFAELSQHETSSAIKKVAEEYRGKQESAKQSGSRAKDSVSRILDEIDAADEEIKEQKWRLLSEEEMEAVTLEMYERGSYSPIYGDEKQTMPGIEILNEAEDERKRAEKRSKHENTSGVNSTSFSSAEREMLAVAQRGMSNDEASFAVEAPLEAQTFLWSEKYRPRKPRYFNRVHTGFEWNKYNQTHYDMDNPPPKIVQGYRFNIFYPDLLDVTQTPSFSVTPCNDPDFAVLRFQSGPPYEDIAFKIVNREWEISHKHGYKCQFANGIFQLWFFFKRYRYRR